MLREINTHSVVGGSEIIIYLFFQKIQANRKMTDNNYDYANRRFSIWRINFNMDLSLAIDSRTFT